MGHMLRITNDKGRNFNVRIVRTGDRYGRDDCLTHGAEKNDKMVEGPMVEFYDATHEKSTKFTDFMGRGQFVSRYYITTILGKDRFANEGGEKDTGLDLMGYEPVWKIDAKAMNLVRDWLDNQTEGEI